MANKHTKAQCEFIVRKLAAFEPPRAIALDFCAVFPDTRCDENDVRRMDPTNVVLSPELHALFWQERARAKANPDAAPFADPQARLIMLSNHAKFHNSNNELAVARAVLRQIAEEQGVVGGKPGGMVPAKPGDAKLVAITRTVVDPVQPEPAQ